MQRRAVLIDERKPLGADARLEFDLIERLEHGVIVEDEFPVRENQTESLFGGLMTTARYIEVEPID